MSKLKSTFQPHISVFVINYFKNNTPNSVNTCFKFGPTIYTVDFERGGLGSVPVRTNLENELFKIGSGLGVLGIAPE